MPPRPRLSRSLANPLVFLPFVCFVTRTLMKVDIDAIDVFGRTALMYAVHYGHFECTQLLLSRGASTDIAERNCGATPLHEAVYHGTPLLAYA